MYKLPILFNNEPVSCIITEDGRKSIPFDPDNIDYQEYLKWLAAGNTPLPADSLPSEGTE